MTKYYLVVYLIQNSGFTSSCVTQLNPFRFIEQIRKFYGNHSDGTPSRKIDLISYQDVTEEYNQTGQSYKSSNDRDWIKKDSK